ncbi:MAG: fructose-bisphosphate aldolase class I [Candidatus Velthaea sp.]
MIVAETALRGVAKAMVSPGKGILAIDESSGTCNKRFAALGIPETPEMRRAYRELLLTGPDLEAHVSGAILYDETLQQSTSNGIPFVRAMEDAGILPGIKVDTGTIPYNGSTVEKITEGLDGLAKRVEKYRQAGARFAKWRAVITISGGLPSRGCMEANAFSLARYARICQDGDLVPIVEPEILMDGVHSLEQCDAVTEETLRVLFVSLAAQGVAFDEMILKPSMVIAGVDAPEQPGVAAVASATVECLRRTVPAAVAGIAFLSGGQNDVRATEHLDAMNRLPVSKPWPLTFSYGRALQQSALEHWRGREARVSEAQRRLLHRAACNGAAALGSYDAALERHAIDSHT